MKPHVIDDEWQSLWGDLQDAAYTALCAALPGLGLSPTPPYCCPMTLAIDKPGDLGEGRVCVDTDARATVEIGDILLPVLCTAVDEVFGEAWFDEAEGPLIDQEPGRFPYADESTGAEWVLELGKETGKVLIECVPVPEAAALLDAIAREAQSAPAPAAGPGEAVTLPA
ncbi:hypothetical protein ACFYW9_23065 [Streptomyces sp. NPDC002698]|uniref:hypothetical protein n=1 Tax=Streptomyces sp. NPDC002698 TaxID=3364660 RepID=UPI0036B407E0